jgi:hypothetical protein
MRQASERKRSRLAVGARKKPVIMRPPDLPFSANRPRGRLLDEQDDEHQHEDLGQHGTGIGFEELVRDTERQRANQRAPEVSNAAEDHDHETVDDVALPEVRAKHCRSG